MALLAHSTTRLAEATRRAAYALAAVLLAVLLAASLFLGAGVRIAWADAPASDVTTGIVITSQDNTTHQYAAHKLLSGTVSNGAMTDPSLQGCVPKSAFEAAGAAAQDVSTPAALANWLAESLAKDSHDTFVVELANAVLQTESKEGLAPAASFSTGTAQALEEGYWLVTSDDAQPMLVLVGKGQVVKAQEKSTVPTVSKSVGKSDAIETGIWSDSTTAGAGDVVSFHVEVTLPSNLASFSNYGLFIDDKLSDGLQYVDTPVVRLRHEDGTTDDIELMAEVDEDSGQNMTVGSDDLLASVPGIKATDVIVLEYQCAVGASAARGLRTGNVCPVVVQYRRSPTTEETGTTVPASAVVYCLQIDLHKVNAKGASLADARFVIQDEDGAYRTDTDSWSPDVADAQVVVTDENGIASFVGLAEGTYTLTETDAPQGYKVIAQPITVTLALARTSTGSATLTATASGSGATVASIDAAAGIATVQVEDPAEGSSDDKSADDPADDNPTDDKPADKPTDEKSADDTSTQRTSSDGSSLGQRLARLVPKMGDLLPPLGGGVLLVSAGFIIVGALMRHPKNDGRDDG